MAATTVGPSDAAPGEDPVEASGDGPLESSGQLPDAAPAEDLVAAPGKSPATSGPGRHWPKRLLIGLNVFVALCLIGAGSTYGYVRYRFGQIKRVGVAGLIAPGTKFLDGQVADAPQTPLNIMIVGSDSRAVISPAEAKAFGTTKDSTSQRSDTLMVLHLDPAARSASLISIPRDLWVPISDGRNIHNRINTAFEVSPDLLVKTVEDNLGISINHFVELDFNSFRQVVNSLGGVKFWYPEPLRDAYSGLNITTPGCYGLDGNMALALVRARHVQYQDNGRWIYESQSDLARIRRQQLFVKKVVAKAQDAGLTKLSALNGVIGGIVTNVTVDKAFSQQTMLRLAKRYASFDPNKLVEFTLPTTEAVIPVSDGNADVLLPIPDQDKAVIDAFQGVAPPAPSSTTPPGGPVATMAPSSVSVGVLNGTGRTMEATQATDALRAQGFRASISGYGKADHFGYATSVIRYAPADEAKARFLQSAVTGGATLEPDASAGAGTLVFITGTTYGGIHAPQPGAAPPAESTSTTTAPLIPANLPPNNSQLPAFPGSHGSDPPPPGSGCS